MTLNILVLLGIVVVSLFIFSANYVQKTVTSFVYPTTPPTPSQNNETNVIQLSTTCRSDSDCSWQLTNCCSENAGGNWECINSQKSVVRCEQLVLCPQVPSPKPSLACKCISNECESQ